MSLREYVRKRDFHKTAEPRGRVAKARAGERRFVIQKHAATRLHYDFRLELDGTLKSWAVPKGVPFAKGDRRLAVQVEDHPLEYAEFEGIIPQGEYGGGTVMVWDRGTYECLGGDPARDLARGKLHFALRGKKLRGEWTLVRIKGGEDHQWLLIKSDRDLRPIGKKRDDESVATGRTMALIARERDATWHSKAESEKPRKLRFIEPMKAKLVAAPPSGAQWSYELKFDGYRALALKEGRRVELLSSNSKDFTARFPDIAAAIGELSAKSAIFDGEIVALDSAGRSSFQALQAYALGTERPPLLFYVFDLLRHDGKDLRALPLHARRERLQSLVQPADGVVRFSPDLGHGPARLLAEVRERGLEGIIGKRRDSKYEPGRRGGAWIKLKCVQEQEVVIGGCTPPAGTRKHFGALLVGFYARGKLQFAGKVGTGFNAALLKALHARMEALRVEGCPFANLPEKQGGRWSQNITPREMKRCRWAEPRLVAQVRFTEWTRDGKLRHPVFIGLREDKDARKVVREVPA